MEARLDMETLSVSLPCGAESSRLGRTLCPMLGRCGVPSCCCCGWSTVGPCWTIPPAVGRAGARSRDFDPGASRPCEWRLAESRRLGCCSVEKKEARRPGSCEMEDEAGRVFGVVELVDEEEKFEELVLLS